MGLGIGRGGTRRPVNHFRAVGTAVLLVAVALVLSMPGAAAHGGTPTVQLAAERVNPGGTLDLLGDMTTEGPAEILLIGPAEASAWSLGIVEAEYEGHFRAFLAIPVDVPPGEYRVRAQTATETATTSVLVAGPPVGGEEGQLPGQDESFAGVPTTGSASIAPVAVPTIQSDRPGADVKGTSAIIAVVVGLAILVGQLARWRSTRVRAVRG